MVSSVINQLDSFQFLDVSPLLQHALSVLRIELLEEDMDGIRSSTVRIITYLLTVSVCIFSLTCVAKLNTCCTSSWVSVGFFRNNLTIAVSSCSCTYRTQ